MMVRAALSAGRDGCAAMAGQGSHGPGEPGCAERVRASYLGKQRPGQDIPADLLNQIAVEIITRCGFSPLKAHRLARGWTVPQAISAFHVMCRTENVKPRGLVARSWLEWEAGARPSWDYQDLVSRLLQTSAVGLGWATDYSPNDMPDHQPEHPTWRENAPRTWRQPMLHLPPDTDDFAGRADQVRELAGFLSAPRTTIPVTVISGKPGVGKTTLAIHVAHKVRDEFPDGQMYANLRGGDATAADPAGVLAGFLRELEVDGNDIPEGLDERSRMYRTLLAGRRVLVVLDNAVDESHVRPLLPGGPGCAVLLTSRARLAGLAGAHPVPLDVMPSSQAVELLSKVIGDDRTQDARAALEEIARLCGHLPLALRIAGARLVSRPAWPVSWFAAKLGSESQRLDLLKAGDLEVRACFAVSYDERDIDEQRAFRLLGLVSSGDFPAWNLAALLGIDADHAERLLERLVDAELVEIAGVDSTGLIRYQLHDLLADFAKERLAEAESESDIKYALRRLTGMYIAMAHQACHVLNRTTELYDVRASDDATQSATALVDQDPQAWLTAERARLVTVVEQAHAFQLWDQAWRLTGVLPILFDWRADWRSWEHTHRLALEATRNLGDERAEASILTTLGMLYGELGRYAPAMANLRRAADTFLVCDEKRHWATALRYIGDTFRYQGRLAEAIEAFDSALAVFKLEGDLRGAAGVLNGMADASRGLCQWEAAERYFQSCIAIYDDLGESVEKARTQVRYAMVSRDRLRSKQAHALLNEAIDIFRNLADRGWEARALRQLAIVRRNDGKGEEALSLLDQVMEIYADLADQRGLAVTLRNRGDTRRLVGDYPQAADDLAKALTLFGALGDDRWAARTRLSMAALCRRQEGWSEASEHAGSALDTFRRIGDRPAQGWALRELGIALREQERYREASEALTECERLFADLGDPLWQARAIACHARLDHRRGHAARLDRATALCHQEGITGDAEVSWILSEW